MPGRWARYRHGEVATAFPMIWCMSMILRILFGLALLCTHLIPVGYVSAQQTATLNGRVIDASESFPLVGANVVLFESEGNVMVAGAATGADGQYSITGIEPGSYQLAFRFVGYQEARRSVTLTAGETQTVDVSLEAGGFDLNAIVVSASRHAEKVLDSPASISVLGLADIENDVVSSSAAILRNTTGVDMAQTGIDRYEIVLRGFNNAFSGAAYVLTDYRQGAIASLGVNAYQMMPITQIDLERVEVVRGPGSALYGAGVDAGVIHFLSKDPFQYPGTTITVGGGTRDMFMGSLRHAGVVNDRLGYKFVGNFTRAEEWHFDPDDRLDSLQLASFRPTVLPLDYDNWKYNLNGTLAYRLSPGATLTANGGYSSSKSIFLSGIGTLQSRGFGYSYGQLRLQAGDFFAQAYVNANDAGESAVLRDAAVQDVVDNSLLYNAQAQYDASLAADRLRLIVGADYEHTMSRTEGKINGRNEDDDTIVEAGAYAQGTYVVTPKLDATIALRGDYHNVVDEFQVSPRAALVYKINPSHSVRTTFNRAFSSPGTNSLFLDINAGRVGPLSIQARGAFEGFEFQRRSDGSLIASSLIREAFGAPVPVGMPLDIVYAQVYAGLASIPAADLQAILASKGLELSVEQVAALVSLLSPESGTNVAGATDSRLGWLNLSTLTIGRTGTDVVSIAPLKQTISQTLEVGYKGLFNDRFLFAVDAYYVKKKNFIGPLLVESPFVLAPPPDAVVTDLEAAMAAGIGGNPQLAGALEQFGVPPEVVANLITELSADALEQLLPAENSPIGIVQPLAPGAIPIPGQLLLSYRNFGEVDYYGVDLSAEALVTERLDVFGNLSWLSDNFFDAEELGEAEGAPELSMNAPDLKLKAGFNYAAPRGVRFGAAVRHISSFEVLSGPYEGEVEAYTLVDVNAGYDLSALTPGLTFDLAVLNVFDEVHREFIGAPQLGRLALARLTYTR